MPLAHEDLTLGDARFDILAQIRRIRLFNDQLSNFFFRGDQHFSSWKPADSWPESYL